MPALDPNPSPWTALTAEFDSWQAAGMRATLWWRDDDATRPTPALTRLLALTIDKGLPLALAVIPQPATPALVALLKTYDEQALAILPHGWAHTNHNPAGQPKRELGVDRLPTTVVVELLDGLERCRHLFGRQLVPILVPPWNRLDPGLLPALPELGFAALSTIKARPYPAPPPAAEDLPDILQLNTHCDVIDWTGDRGFIGLEPAIACLVAHLRARRTGQADPEEPTGLLTHHLAHDEATWAFLATLIDQTRHPAAAWISIATCIDKETAKMSAPPTTTP